jgi:UDP-2,3-diacylglucosamine hydrolase
MRKASRAQIHVLPLPALPCSQVVSQVRKDDNAGTVLVASDVHLGTISEEQEHAFASWLDQAAAAAPWIVLNGDIFDFWFEYRWGTSRGYDSTLTQLRRIVDSGVRVTLMGGNHDWWGGTHLRDEVGVEFLQDPVTMDMAGLRTFLAHGDGLGKGGLAYRALRLMFRGRWTRFAFGMLPPRLGDWVGGGVSQTENKWKPSGPAELETAKVLKEWAFAELTRRPELDLVLLGHTHVPMCERMGENGWYVNSGDWVYHRSYVILREGEDPRIVQWEGAVL